MHPGVALKKKFLDPHGISQVELAEHLGVSFQRVNEIVNGRRGITPETAILLAQAFDTNPEFWILLQARYDLDSFRQSTPVKVVKLIV